jgi:hypothetical protein
MGHAQPGRPQGLRSFFGVILVYMKHVFAGEGHQYAPGWHSPSIDLMQPPATRFKRTKANGAGVHLQLHVNNLTWLELSGGSTHFVDDGCMCIVSYHAPSTQHVCMYIHIVTYATTYRRTFVFAPRMTPARSDSSLRFLECCKPSPCPTTRRSPTLAGVDQSCLCHIGRFIREVNM